MPASNPSEDPVPTSLLDRKVRFPPEVLIQQVGGESVLLDLKSEEYFGLDPVGTRIMALANEASSIRAALEQVSLEFEVDRATLERDALELIAECAAQGLVVINDP